MENILQNTTNNDFFLQKQMEVMIETNNKRLANELSNIKNILNKLNEEICELKKKNSDNAREHVREQMPNSENNIKDKEQITNKEQPTKRYGNYNPEEISVEKFFYFGNKPR